MLVSNTIRIFLASCSVSLILLIVLYTQLEWRPPFLFNTDSGHKINIHFEPSRVNNDTLSKVGIITFLSTRHVHNEDSHQTNDHRNEPDDFYNATRVLAYKLLHDPNTKTQRNIPLLVMVTKSVDSWKRDQLIEDGAHVFEVDYIPVDKSMQKGEKRWIDQYTKLRLWELTMFDRMLYIDADMLVSKCLDGIFDDPAAYPLPAPESEKDNIPSTYLLAGVDDVFGPNNPIPRPDSENFNAGFFVFQPSKELFRNYHLMMAHAYKYNSNQMEQGLLNYVHRLDGNMPWQRLTPGRWSVTWPSYKDYEYGVATLHDKLWSPTRDTRLHRLWMNDYESMVRYENEHLKDM